MIKYLIKDIKDEWGYFRYDIGPVWSGKRTLIDCIANVFMTLFIMFSSAFGFILAVSGWYRLLENKKRV